MMIFIVINAYQRHGIAIVYWRLLLVRDFVQAVAQQDAGILTSTIDESIESHPWVYGRKSEVSIKLCYN